MTINEIFGATLVITLLASCNSAQNEKTEQQQNQAPQSVLAPANKVEMNVDEQVLPPEANHTAEDFMRLSLKERERTISNALDQLILHAGLPAGQHFELKKVEAIGSDLNFKIIRKVAEVEDYESYVLSIGVNQFASRVHSKFYLNGAVERVLDPTKPDPSYDNLKTLAPDFFKGIVRLLAIYNFIDSPEYSRSDLKSILGENVDIGRGFVTQYGGATGLSCLAFDRGEYNDAGRYVDLTHGQELPQGIRLSYAEQAKLGFNYRSMSKNGNVETSPLTGSRKTQIGAGNQIMPMPIDTAQWTYQVIEEADQLAKTLDVTLKEKHNAAGGAASATVSASFAQKSAFSHKKTQVLFDTRIYSHSIVMDTHADLNQNYIVKIAKDFWPTVGSQEERTKRWQESCGNNYVSSIHYGASLSILLELDMDQSEFTRETNLEMSGKGTFAVGDAKTGTSFYQAIAKLTSTRRAVVKNFMIGGAPLNAAFEKSIFTITDLGSLEQQVRLWVTETVNGGFFAPISYETASYDTVNGWNELQNSIKLSDAEDSALAGALKYIDELNAFSKSVQDVVGAPFAFATKLNEKDDAPLWSDDEEKELKQLSPKNIAQLLAEKGKYENRARNIRRVIAECWARNFNENSAECAPYFKMFGKSTDDIDMVPPIVGLRAEIKTEVALLPRRVMPGGL